MYEKCRKHANILYAVLLQTYYRICSAKSIYSAEQFRKYKTKLMGQDNIAKLQLKTRTF